MMNGRSVSAPGRLGGFWPFVAAAVVLGPGSCGGTGKAVRPDEMSAEQHRAEAHRENVAASDHAKLGSPAAGHTSPFRDPISSNEDYLYPMPVYNPNDWHLAEVDKHRAHAQQHEAAAQSLEKFEEATCGDFPPATRAACPLLGPALEIHDTDGGVSIRMAPSVRVDAVVAHMKCHFAYARSHGYLQATSCPLYLPGLMVKRGADPATVEITVADKWRIAELRRHATEEVVISTRPR